MATAEQYPVAGHDSMDWCPPMPADTRSESGGMREIILRPS